MQCLTGFSIQENVRPQQERIAFEPSEQALVVFDERETP